jgi:hypothetical protein
LFRSWRRARALHPSGKHSNHVHGDDGLPR